MVEYLEPAAIKFILITAAIAAIVAIADIILILRSRGTARLKELLPAVDSVLVIAGFMAFTGTFLVLTQSAGKIAGSNPLMETVLPEITQRWEWGMSANGWQFTFKVMVSALTTAIIAWLLFFVFFEVWYFLRFMLRRNMKKVTASS